MGDRHRERLEREEEQRAAQEAAQIGGGPRARGLDPAQQAPLEAGEGVAEGFEAAEEELIEHASHGDEHSGRQPYHHRSMIDEEGEPLEGGEADHFLSSEREEGS